MRRILAAFAVLILVISVVACQPAAPGVHGYVEGEFIRVAPTSAGLLETISVTRGQTVRQGEELFSLDLTELTAGRDKALMELKHAQAIWSDLKKGARAEEIEVIRKQQAQAQAQRINAQLEYERVQRLSQTGATSVSARDNAKAVLDSATARVDELVAQLKTARLGARPDQIDAALATVNSAKQIVAQFEKKRKDAAPLAPAAGVVEDTYFQAGEYVAAGQPVVSVLAPDHIKIRFYVSQKRVPKLKVGHPVSIRCDGCADPIEAHIDYIAPRSEYTPPVIFSVESRNKLVFLIEAKPNNFHSELRPGLPVDVDLGL
ncbi:MAG: HlyD family efflux transporter periplasmic adaptor subunit [Gammaproteobacteria bacterium]